jgi:hypothetical protein
MKKIFVLVLIFSIVVFNFIDAQEAKDESGNSKTATISSDLAINPSINLDSNSIKQINSLIDAQMSRRFNLRCCRKKWGICYRWCFNGHIGK